MRLTRAAVLAGITLLFASQAAARPPGAEDMLALVELGDYRGGLSLSPDGLNIAVFARETRVRENDYRYRLLVMSSAGGAPRRIADAGDIILRNTPFGPTGAAMDRAPAWSPDSRYLAYLAAREGRVELWRVALDGSPAELLVDGPGDVLRFQWLDDNNLVVEIDAPRGSLSAATLHAERVGFHPDEFFTPYASLRPFAATNAGRTQFVMDVQTRTRRSATSAESEVLNGRPHAPAPNTAIAEDRAEGSATWIAPRTPGDRASTPALGLYRAQLDGGSVIMCADPACSGRMLGAWVFGERIVFRRMEGHGQGLTALYAWDGRANTVHRIRREDEELFGCARAATRLVCMQENPLQPRRIVSIDVDTGDLIELYDPNPGWRAFDQPRIETIEVNDAYGNASFAHLAFPARYRPGRRYPVVVVQYRSRGFLRGGVGGEYPILPLAGRGYFVLSVDRPEWRGAEAALSQGELDQRTALDNSENLMKQSALEAMLAELDRRGLSDPRRIGITGFSDGAETLYWAITNSHLFAVAVASTQPTDMTAWTLGSRAFRQSLLSEGMRGPNAEDDDPWAAWWARNTTVLHAERIRAPLLMNLAESEAIMGFPLATRLEELNRPFDLYVYPGAYHIKWRPAQLLAAQTRAMDWLDFWLRGVEREDPDEPGRLERWRALRDRTGSR
ncbi:Atxe2 family lasso peptide isopeptidase [Vitreimonas sp.]|uniref:Atxe2 family lasso peptide isopeptidase n=1 Tax=Vitreimonas sp. TaxID=3069702 RepID=UPI002EDA4B65